MAGPFTRRRDGSVDVTLSAVEAGALQQVARDLLEALRAPEERPTLRRLFPPAYEDAAAQDDFAVMTRSDLTERKRANARAVLDALEPAPRKKDRVQVRLDDEGAHRLLGMLNDARLVIGESIEVTEEMDALPADDPRAPAHNLYVYLSGLEWALVDALAG